MKFSQALYRFAAVVAVAWVLMLVVPIPWFITTYLPVSFFLLMGLVTFGVCGLGWPFAAPMGTLKTNSRVGPGLLMVAVWIILAMALAWVEANVWPHIPLATPAAAWFGIIVFGVTLWYTFDHIGPHPTAKPWANWLIATAVILLLTGIIWVTCVNFKGFPPLEHSPANPQGFFAGPFWFGLCVWVIVWVQVFGDPMCLQGWPFYKLGSPLHQILLTVTVVVLGYACWVGSLALGISPTFSFGAIGASMIGWSLMHAVAFQMYPFAQYVQPKRGIYNFVLEEIVLTAVWIVILRIILPPIWTRFQAGMNELGLPPNAFDINMLSAFFTLHVTAVVLLIHELFFARVPLSAPSPPLGPEELPAAAPQV